MNDREEAIMLGRILATVAAIDEKISRLVWRADQQEDRLEKLEERMVVMEEADKHSLARKLADKAVFAVLGAAGVVGLKAMGWV